MAIQYSKVVCSILLSLLAVILFLRNRREERKLCMVAMILSCIGDIFMTDVLKLGSAGTVPGAAFFILAHIVYAVCFFRAGKRNRCRILNNGFTAGVCLTVSAAALLTILMLAKTGRVQAMYVPILGYLAFVGLNLITQFSYSFNRKGSFYFLPAAMTLFLISDFLVFLPMLAVVQESVIYDLVIWMFYLPAQLLIILFNSPASKKVMNK
ncbi:MAG: lysoplasmalogenase family protein [Eubacteriales bacterium]|nr:lysoplasmalogenase family protein [Eubacteriales bacterium]